jgi:rubrerythrin
MLKTDILAALDAAIRGEAEAQAFYRAAAENTDDPGGRAMFRELAQFEAHHQRHLEALKQSLAAGGAWVAYEGRTLSKMPAGEVTGVAAPGAHSGALEALRIAIGAEEKAEAQYRALSRSASDRVGQEMFERIAAEEADHRKLLNDQFYALSNHGVWVWGD